MPTPMPIKPDATANRPQKGPSKPIKKLESSNGEYERLSLHLCHHAMLHITSSAAINLMVTSFLRALVNIRRPSLYNDNNAIIAIQVTRPTRKYLRPCSQSSNKPNIPPQNKEKNIPIIAISIFGSNSYMYGLFSFIEFIYKMFSKLTFILQNPESCL